MKVHFLKTDLIGTLAAFWDFSDSGVSLKRISFMGVHFSVERFISEHSDFEVCSSCLTETLFEKISAYLKGEVLFFSLDGFDFSGVSLFRKCIYNSLFKTLPGDIVSYGELALMSGYKNAYRAVGTAMKLNPFPIIIPCHRVVLSNGFLGGYAGGSDIKLKLLEIERSMVYHDKVCCGEKT